MDLEKRTNLEKKQIVHGGYTSYYRYLVEPCLVDAQKCDIRNMELLGFSKLNPYYLLEKVKRYFSRKY